VRSQAWALRFRRRVGEGDRLAGELPRGLCGKKNILQGSTAMIVRVRSHAVSGQSFDAAARWAMPMAAIRGMMRRRSVAPQHLKDIENQRAEKGVRFIKAWADPKAGKVFCLSEGPDMDSVQRVHERSGHRADEIYEVSIEEE
jgi:hypothetical protein